ncbi:MAG: hypothetical protein LUC16_02800 [Coprobacillus sp.]|nr:hypothetical protein [Coprobacillus sp.]
MSDNYGDIIDNDQPVPQGLWRNAMSIYRGQWASNWILSFIFILITCAVLLIGLYSYTAILIIVLIPLIILPFFYATLSAHYKIYKSGEKISIKSYFSDFAAFFNRKSRGVFSFWRSLLFYIIAYLLCSIIFEMVAMLVCQSVDPGLYEEMINGLSTITTSYPTFGEVYDVLGDEAYRLYMTYLAVASMPTMAVPVIFFIFCVFKSSLTIYYRQGHPSVNPASVNNTFSMTSRNVGSPYRKDLWSMLGPIIGLYVFGYVLTAVLLYFFVDSFGGYYYYPSMLGIVGGFVAIFFFMPFYMPASISFYEKWGKEYDNSNLKYAAMMADRYAQQAQMAEQQRRAMEDQMREQGIDPDAYRDQQPNSPNNESNDDSTNNDNSGSDDSGPDDGGFWSNYR